MPREVNSVRIIKTMFRIRKRIFKAIIKFIVFCLVMAVLGGIAVSAYLAKDLPDPTKIEERQIVESTNL